MKKRFIVLLFLTLGTQLLPAQLYLLNDEFNDPCTHSSWLRLNDTEGWDADQLEVLDVNTLHPGQLTMKPYTCVWYNDYRGPLVYKLVSGNFVFTTRVTVSGGDGTGIPTSQFSLGGVMIRVPKPVIYGNTDWAPGHENYVFLSAGYATPAHASCPAGCGPGPHFEVKKTENSVSELAIMPIPSPTVTIRMARVGDVIIVLRQLPGGDFVVHQRYRLPDLPEEVQVGFVTYTNWEKASSYFGGYGYAFQNGQVLNEGLADDPTPSIPFRPDLLARFDYARFNEVDLPPGLAFVNLLNTAAVSDADLLAFLDFPSEPSAEIEDPAGYLAVYETGRGRQQVWQGMTWTELNDRWTALGAANLRLVDVDAYRHNGQWLYLGVWRAGTSKYALYLYSNRGAFLQKEAELAADHHRLIDLETIRYRGAQWYLGTWNGNGDNQLKWYTSRHCFLQDLPAMSEQGFRVVDLERVE